jgi:tetratricopeptide (TPR) repeat protein
MGDAARGAELVERLLHADPDDLLLVRFAAPLLEHRYSEFCMGLAENHRRLAPEDAEGPYLYGEALLTRINSQIEPMERLPEARSALQRAVELRDDHFPAALSLANALRLEKRYDEAKGVFSILLERHPDSAQVHFNLAAMSVEREPELALVHFQEGEKLEPEDPDYPVGVARALLRLERKEEAREALKRAKKLIGSHPRFAELEAALRSG